MKSSAPILVVDDDIVDTMSVQRALRELAVPNPCQVIHSAEQALDHLRTPGAVLPGLILLDLNMPRLNGIEFLRQIKADAQLRRIPVVILSTSKEEQDQRDSFDVGAAGYMTKPIGHDEFVQVMRTIVNYWTLSEAGP